MKSKFRSIKCLNQSAKLSDKTNSRNKCIQVIIYVWLFSGVKLCKCNVHDDPSSPQRYTLRLDQILTQCRCAPTIASDVILNTEILHNYIALISASIDHHNL